MDAKKLYKKHLKLAISNNGYISPKQMVQIKYEVAIDAIEEALKIKL